MNIMDNIRNAIRGFLRIDNTNISQIQLSQKLTYNNNAVKNKVWYNGKSNEIEELCKQLDVSPNMFWKSSPSDDNDIRKIHTGLPKLIVDILTNIIVNDFNGVTIESENDKTLQPMWEDIYNTNKGDKLLKKCVRTMLVVGDGAYKITFNGAVDTTHPIIEFVSGEFVDYTRMCGRITEVIFTAPYIHDGHNFSFCETYGKGYIKYALYDRNGAEIETDAIPQTAWTNGSSGVTFDTDVMLAVPVIFGDSEEYTGRGQSIFDNKIDCFDALDEIFSQWIDAVRAGRAKTFIPQCLTPRNPFTGELIKPNAFDNRFITTGNDMSENGAGNKIYTEQPTIPTDNYLASYITALDLCLQGLISPSTLGIDVKKLDNADAQREKEKATLYTRGNIIQTLNEVFPQLVAACICGTQLWLKQSISAPNQISVNFGEYANPSFESQVETIAKAKTGGLMSVETIVEELYGDSKSDDWKKEEVERLKAEQGLTSADEMTVGDDIGDAI